MWYWYELLFIGIITDLILEIFFKKYLDKTRCVITEYISGKFGGKRK